jgi:hypothetical protein
MGEKFCYICVVSGAVVLLLALLAVGCGGSGDPASPPAGAPPTTASTATTTTAAFSNTVTGTTGDQQGNKVTITIGVGSPQPLEKLSDSVATSCNPAIKGDGLSVSDAVAIPLRVSATLTSSLKAPYDVDLSEVFYIEGQSHGVQPLKNNTSLSELWAAAYTNSEPQCPTPAEVKWAAEAVTPHAPGTWEPWLVIAGAITPNDPSGQAVTDTILIRPGAGVGSSYGDGDLTPQGSGWVRCSVDEAAAHSEPYLAVDPTTAEADGCSAST